MNILLINKSDTQGGAAVAANRLLQALSKSGVSAKMLVQEKRSDDTKIVSTSNSRWKKWKDLYHFIIERLLFLPYEKSKEIRFAFSIGKSGENISSNTLVESADVLHLHWFNQGYLSVENVLELTQLNKPVVWTLHDMWAFTGGCHYAGACENYKNECANCHFLKNPKNPDLSTKVFQHKQKAYKNTNITIVTCSQWLGRKAKESSLLADFNIISIPNPINTDLFKPQKQSILREKYGLHTNKKLILFAAANVSDKRKGIRYFIEAIQLLSTKHTESINNYELIVFGKSSKETLQEISLPVHSLGYLDNVQQIAEIYALSDLFILPSLEDNLPNTVMESLACGTPVVAFNTGGIPEMIDHKSNGYLADYKSSEDLANGILHILNADNYSSFRENARKKVEDNFSEQKVAKRYSDLYKTLNKS